MEEQTGDFLQPLQEENLMHETKIRVYSGKYVNPFDFRKEDVDIFTIAKALSNTCRFGGHMDRFYSVADHSIFVASMSGNKLAALLHDASEAYLFDVSTPMKVWMRESCPALLHHIDNIQVIINEVYGISPEDAHEYKTADVAALKYEWELGVLDNIILSTPETSYINFLKKFYDYSKGSFDVRSNNWTTQHRDDYINVKVVLKKEGVI